MFNQRSSNTASPNTPDAPAPPAGYQLRSVVRYPVVVVTVTSAAIFFITTPLFIWLAWRLQAVSSHPFLLPLTIEDSFLALAGSIATVGIHELTHILILRAYGYKTVRSGLEAIRRVCRGVWAMAAPATRAASHARTAGRHHRAFTAASGGCRSLAGCAWF